MSHEAAKLLIDSQGAPLDRIVGIETEYARNLTLAGAEGLSEAELERCIYELGDRLDFEAYRGKVADNEPNFKIDGNREYRDIGQHPEVSVAEDISFTDTAFRVVRGHVKTAAKYRPEIIEDANSKIRYLYGLSHDPITSVQIDANNFDPNTSDSWGCHLNLLASRQLEVDDYAPALIANAVSRHVYAGPGVVRPVDEDGAYMFCLSDKAFDIWQEIGNDSVRNRPLIHTKDEPLADELKWRRIHDIANDTVINPYVNALRLAASSIILRAVELGEDFEDLHPANSIIATRQVSADPSLKQTIELKDGRHLTALEIQSELAERAISLASRADYLTEQESFWGDEWQRLVGDLGRDPNDCIDRVDWVIKKGLIERALALPRKPKETDFHVAWMKATQYSRVSPEGIGMKMIRTGKFALSPSADILENGVPLPPTRAKLRSATIIALKEAGVDFMAGWTLINPYLEGRASVRLLNPYATASSGIEQLLEYVHSRSLEEIQTESIVADIVVGEEGIEPSIR